MVVLVIRWIVVIVIVIIWRFVILPLFVVRVALNALWLLPIHCLGFRRRGVPRSMPRVPIHGSLTLLTRVVDRFRFLRCQVSVDEVSWEHTERLDVFTAPVVRDEGWWWIPHRRWDRVSELTLVVDLDRWGISFSWRAFGAMVSQKLGIAY